MATTSARRSHHPLEGKVLRWRSGPRPAVRQFHQAVYTGARDEYWLMRRLSPLDGSELPGMRLMTLSQIRDGLVGDGDIFDNWDDLQDALAHNNSLLPYIGTEMDEELDDEETGD